MSPMEVLEAQIERIEALNDKINCIAYRHYDEARTAASESERRYREGKPRPLEGISIAVKDEYQTKGWVTTKGSLLLKDTPPATEDNAVIDRLRHAGPGARALPARHLCPQRNGGRARAHQSARGHGGAGGPGSSRPT